jgi:hypothetical protein
VVGQHPETCGIEGGYRTYVSQSCPHRFLLSPEALPPNKLGEMIDGRVSFQPSPSYSILLRLLPRASKSLFRFVRFVFQLGQLSFGLSRS